MDVDVTPPPAGDVLAVAEHPLHQPIGDTRVKDRYEALADISFPEKHFADHLPESTLFAKELSRAISAPWLSYSRIIGNFLGPPLVFTPYLDHSPCLYPLFGCPLYFLPYWVYGREYPKGPNWPICYLALMTTISFGLHRVKAEWTKFLSTPALPWVIILGSSGDGVLFRCIPFT